MRIGYGGVVSKNKVVMLPSSILYIIPVKDKWNGPFSKFENKKMLLIFAIILF